MSRGVGQRVDPPVIFTGLDWRYDLHLYLPHDPYHPTPFDPNRDTEVDVTGWDGKIELTHNAASSTAPISVGVVLDQPTHGRLHYFAPAPSTTSFVPGTYSHLAWLHDTTGTYLPGPGWFAVTHGQVLVQPGP